MMQSNMVLFFAGIAAAFTAFTAMTNLFTAIMVYKTKVAAERTEKNTDGLVSALVKSEKTVSYKEGEAAEHSRNGKE